MKNLHKRISISVAMFALFGLGACSRQTMPTLSSCKLSSAQMLQTHQTKVDEPNSKNVTATFANTASPTPTIASTSTAQEAKGSGIDKPVKLPKAGHRLMASFSHKAASGFLKQSVALKQMIAPKNAVAYERTNEAQGLFLGLAVVCLIVGLVLVFLGFGALGSLFWVIGIVIFVVAVVFFILWLLGEAVAG